MGKIVILKYKSHLLPVADVWFSRPNSFNASCYAKCSYYLHTPYSPMKGEYLICERKSMTLENDLELSDEELLTNCESNVRNEIRRAKRESVKCQVFTSAELIKNPTLVEQFCNSYDDMHREKGMQVVSVMEFINRAIIKGVLLLSVTYIDTNIVAYHVYIAGDNIARLLYSVSVFRSVSSNSERSAIGRANRLLHYEDMLWFKKNKFYFYDWGGYSTDSSLEGINSFKKGFGGKLKTRFNYVTTTHITIQLLYKAKQRLRHNG